MAKYLFIHIPKTAGVKLRHNIHMNVGYPQARICVPEEGSDLRYHSDVELQSFDLISGHFGYALRRRLEPGRRCLTLLRKPLERAISTYYYWKTLPSPHSQITQLMSIEEFLVSKHPLVTEYVDNAQVWQIFSDYTLSHRHRFADLSRRELLMRAREHLASMDFVGIQEDMPGCLNKMKRRFEWQWTDDPLERINPTPGYDLGSLDLDALRRKAGDRLALDDELYSYAAELYAGL
jgi:hypothetical protein